MLIFLIFYIRRLTFNLMGPSSSIIIESHRTLATLSLRENKKKKRGIIIIIIIRMTLPPRFGKGKWETRNEASSYFLTVGFS